MARGIIAPGTRVRTIGDSILVGDTHIVTIATATIGGIMVDNGELLYQVCWDEGGYDWLPGDQLTIINPAKTTMVVAHVEQLCRIGNKVLAIDGWFGIITNMPENNRPSFMKRTAYGNNWVSHIEILCEGV